MEPRGGLLGSFSKMIGAEADFSSSNHLRPLFHILIPSIDGNFLRFPIQQLILPSNLKLVGRIRPKPRFRRVRLVTCQFVDCKRRVPTLASAYAPGIVPVGEVAPRGYRHTGEL